MHKKIKLFHITLEFREFQKVVKKYMDILEEHYGGVMTPTTMLIHLKPCPRDVIIYSSELYVTSTARKN